MESTGTNIWIAIADGDTQFVQAFLATSSPDVKDANGYTPIAAAVSYSRLDILQLLLDHGADINITDNDGDTPLYFLENVETARFLVQCGAQIDTVNNDGISPIEHLSEEFPEVAQYLQSVQDSRAVVASLD